MGGDFQSFSYGTGCIERGQCRNGTCLPFCETQGLQSCMCDTRKHSFVFFSFQLQLFFPRGLPLKVPGVGCKPTAQPSSFADLGPSCSPDLCEPRILTWLICFL